MTLSEITLACVDTANPELAVKAIHRCQAQLQFGRSILFTDRPVMTPGIEVIQVNDIHDISSYSRFVIRELGSYIKTTHLLLIQWDGYVLHPEAWDPDFLSYDYIGATWPANHQGPEMVGNGGFSLRSKKLLQTLNSIEFVQFHPEDQHIARTHRAQLESMGIRFAPPVVGDRFAYEFKTPQEPTFGFHGFSNFPDFMTTTELSKFIAAMPAGLVFNNYFLEFARKVLVRTRLHAHEAGLWTTLAAQINRDICNATSQRLIERQAKHLISGLCRLKLGTLARQIARRRLAAAPSIGNLRLLIKTFFAR